MEVMEFPKDHKDLVDALEQARVTGWPNRNRFVVWSQIAHYYLRGYRRFRVNDPAEGKVMVGYETQLGELKFRNEDIRVKYKTELGRLMKIDITPSVTRKSWGLDSLRKAAIGQVALDHEISHIEMNQIKLEFLQHVLQYGMAGLGHWRYADAEGKLKSEIEIIPGWELIPIPGTSTGRHGLRAIQRHRKVPLKWVEDKVTRKGVAGLTLPGPKSDSRHQRLETENVSYGSTPVEQGIDPNTWSPGLGSFTQESRETPTGGKSARAKQIYEEFVPLTETWVIGPDWTVKRYIVKVGKEIGLDEEYDQVVPMPMGLGQYIPDGGFYTHGFIGMLIPGNHQQEQMLQTLYQNVHELSSYGTILWPITAGAGKQEFSKPGRPKIVTYEPDYTVPDAKPDTLSPVNTGDFPGRVSQLCAEQQNILAAQGPLFQGQNVGRVESGSGLGFTFEVSQIAQAATAHQIGDCFTQVYRSMLATLPSVMDDSSVLTLMDVDDSVAGIMIDEKGDIALSDNPLPEVHEVHIDIKDRQPVSKEQRKQELMAMLDMGVIDDVEFRLINYKENLELPVGNRAEFEGYRKAIYHNILQFNDGKTPKKIEYDQVLDDPEIHLRAVKAFVARVEFSMAEPPVQQAFVDRLKILQAMMPQYPMQATPDMMAQTAMGALPPQGMQPGAGM